MLETFERFAQQEYVSACYQDPFMRSHPVATERLAQLRDRVSQKPLRQRKDPPQLQLRHDMMRAKLAGYLDRPQTVFNRYPASDNSLPARYARAIARNCSGKCTDALGEVDALIREKPDNPYFWELKGHLLVLDRQISRSHRAPAQGAAACRRRGPSDGGRAGPIVARPREDAAVVDEAITLLRRAIARDDQNSHAYHQLAKALLQEGPVSRRPILLRRRPTSWRAMSSRRKSLPSARMSSCRAARPSGSAPRTSSTTRSQT